MSVLSKAQHMFLLLKLPEELAELKLGIIQDPPSKTVNIF